MPEITFFNLLETKRERFLRAAIDEFADHDYHQASISRLVKQVGIAKGSFYQYFADKKALFFYLIHLVFREKKTLLEEIEIPAGIGWFERLRWAFRLQARFELENPRLAEVGYRARHGDLPFQNGLLEKLPAQAWSGYRRLIGDGIAGGELRPDLDLETATYVLSTLLGPDLGRYLDTRLDLPPRRLYDRQLTPADWEKTNEIFDQLVGFLEAGFGRRET